MKHLITTLLFTFHFSLLTFSFAHWADLSAAEISTSGNITQIILTFPTGLVTQMDNDKNQVLSEDEIHLHHAALTQYFFEHIRLVDHQGQEPSVALSTVGNAGIPADLGIVAGTHSTVKLMYTWKEAPGNITIDYNLFLPGVATASCLATILHDSNTQTFVFTPENRVLTLEQGMTPLWSQVRSFLWLGVEHILTGYDHLLFLLALLALGGGLGYLIKVVSAFTIAHSITLSLAVLDIISLPPRLIESVIALSIAYVASENLWRNRDEAEKWRWLLTFAFGLIHGMGFAGILQEMELPRSALATSLISFNVGVELGQLVFITVAFFLLSLLKRAVWKQVFRYGISLVSVVAGAFWFVERMFWS